MSEIAAIFGTEPGADARMRRIIAAMGEWPHDAHESWIASEAGLSACVQHTTGESLEASQPHANDDGTVRLVLDGYLANYDELRQELAARGARLRNRSDAELVLRAYEMWGEECVEHIEGEFAFVIIDQRERRAFCARDHAGLRPLHYAECGGFLIVASSLPVLLAGLDREPQPDLEYLAETMIGETYSVDRTVWKDVHRLKAAHCLSWSERRSQTRSYYRLPPVSFRRFKRDGDYIEAYRAAFEDAVRRASRSHVPIACEVSGGLDSSAIFCLADAMIGEVRFPAPELEGFTLRGEPGEPSDEIVFAREVACKTGREVREYPLFRPDLAWFDAEGRKYRDMPTYTNAAHSRLMEQAIAESGARAVLTGMGGDQWLDGTWGYYQQALRAPSLARFWRNVSEDGAHYGWRENLPFVLKKSLVALLPDGLRGIQRRARSDYAALLYEQADFLVPHLEKAALRAKRRYLDTLPDNDIDRAHQKKLDAVANQRAYDLMHRQRSEFGLESRNPMLSKRFIEFMITLPEDVKLRHDMTKWVHREAMRGIMPQSIVERTSKATFPDRSHFDAISKMLEEEQGALLQPLVKNDTFSLVQSKATRPEIDDSSAWLYWSCYVVTSFLRNSVKN